MGFIGNTYQKIVGVFVRKAVGFIRSHSLSDALIFGNQFRQSATHGYGKNVYVYASINEILWSMSGIPWILFDTRTGDEIKTEHPLLKLLRNPNPRMGGASFTQTFMGYFLIDGNSYIRSIAPDTGENAGVPQELWPIRPDLIDPAKTSNGQEVVGFNFRPGGRIDQFIPFDEILHLRTFNPLDNFKGLSPISVAALSITQGNESKKWNVMLLQNQARPPGMITTEGNLTEAQRIRMNIAIRRKYGGSENAGMPFIGEGGVKWENFGLSPTDMDWLEGQKLTAREIAIIYGVPPELIGDATNKTYSNFREARKAFYDETILPTMVWLREEYNRWLTPKFGAELRLDFDTDQVSALQEDRAMLFERLNAATFLEINEKREMAGFEPVEGGDVILVPFNLVPLSLVASGSDHDEDDKDKKSAKEVRHALPDDSKAFNIKGQPQKDLYWKTFDRRRVMFFGRVEKLIAKRLNADFTAAARAAGKAATREMASVEAAEAVKVGKTKWFELFESIYLAVGDEFARDVFAQVKSQPMPPEVKQDEFDEEDFRDIWQAEIRAWVQANSTTRILGIIDTSIRKVQKEIRAGIELGEGIPEIAKRLRGLRNISTPARAKLIARTETISASNLGSHAAAKAINIPLRKEWVATPDERVRETHDEANGQIVDGMDSAFQVDGEELLFPGDTSLGATGRNIFNCRCTVVYLTADVAEPIPG